MNRRKPLVLLAVLCAGCTVGPNYKRPTVTVPASFRAPEPLPPGQAASLADLKWFEVFKDDKLQDLMRTALRQNYDLRDAVLRVEEPRANLGITRSNQYPNFGASGGVEINRLSRDGATPLPAAFLPSQNRNFGQATLQLLSFEIDIWGKLRRATEAARANLLSAEENRKAVVTTLVSRWAGFSTEDEIAIVFCGSKKSLAAGIPMANILFAAHAVGLIVLPLMLFHQIQLMVCAALARRFAAAHEPLPANGVRA